MKTLAIIIARGGSKRIPRKNIRIFCGKPIIAYSIKAALESKCFDEVMVSTEDLEIAQIAKEYGASVPFLRSLETSDDKSVTEDVWLEVLNHYHAMGKDFDYFCGLYPCAPFITSERLRNTFEIMKQIDKKAICPIVQYGYPIQRALKIENGTLIFGNREYLTACSQDLPVYYHDAGQFYWYKTELFYRDSSGDFTGMLPIILSETEVQDIDTEDDWKIAEIKYRILQDIKYNSNQK